ncbi:hypothetical protein [Deinococcus maricopensis]|uniref:Uncharacterized protein n=1 Tax=Deinococcus maricopensis (strain DSM 21211 / LMG 22137 / NRRL B-23946 / LB-34) TaxID=709986 RepID=E8U801_DEIML|nr:hypothetical protein [Deinococcus maricopensis]ADV67190.1 hypothetical protein Deima_1541 [Deinococcus maricopensis DSM 21211]
MTKDTDVTTPRDGKRGLSNNMKIALAGLLLFGGVGGWLAYSNMQAPADTTTTDAGTSTGTTSQTGATSVPAPGGTGTSSSTSSNGGVSVVRPDANAQVQQIPFLTPEGTTTGGATTSTDETATPSLASSDATPTANPFQPLRVDATANGTSAVDDAGRPISTAPTGTVATVNTPVRTTTGSTTTPGRTSTTTTTVATGLGTGALPAPEVPGVSTPVRLPSATTFDGTPLTATTGQGATSRPGSTATGTGGPTSTSGTSGATSNPGASTPVATPRPPINTPRPQVQVPSVSTIDLPGGEAIAGTPTTPGGNVGAGPTAGGTPAAGGVVGSAPTTTPSLPPVISQIDTGPQVNALDRFVTERDLSFNAVVLGPVNTSILKTRDGFLVVATGQTLPDSNVVIREVTATSVTLALGSDTKTLELDKR